MRIVPIALSALLLGTLNLEFRKHSLEDLSAVGAMFVARKR